MKAAYSDAVLTKMYRPSVSRRRMSRPSMPSRPRRLGAMAATNATPITACASTVPHAEPAIPQSKP